MSLLYFIIIFLEVICVYDTYVVKLLYNDELLPFFPALFGDPVGSLKLTTRGLFTLEISTYNSGLACFVARVF